MLCEQAAFFRDSPVTNFLVVPIHTIHKHTHTHTLFVVLIKSVIRHGDCVIGWQGKRVDIGREIMMALSIAGFVASIGALDPRSLTFRQVMPSFLISIFPNFPRPRPYSMHVASGLFGEARQVATVTQLWPMWGSDG